jgi:hypothetical protein
MLARDGADARDRTADLPITNQPVLWVFFPENGVLGGFTMPVFRRAGLLWECNDLLLHTLRPLRETAVHKDNVRREG